jgi:hypothetical protein
METDSFTPPNILVTADLARPDLVISDIVEEDGVDYVLGAIGEEAIQSNMESNGYHVLESVKNKAEAA